MRSFPGDGVITGPLIAEEKSYSSFIYPFLPGIVGSLVG